MLRIDPLLSTSCAALCLALPAVRGTAAHAANERAARLPLAAGALSQEVYLKASNSAPNDQFGVSTATSGNTVVVGASFEDSSATGVNGDPTDDGAPDSGAAYVLVRSGTSWSQEAYLKASDTRAGDLFGTAVAISGDTLVAGAPAAGQGGAAYVFVRAGTVWSQEARLTASNTDAGDSFGSALAISGDTILVGARAEDSPATGVNGNQASNAAAQAGAAYVFVRSGTSWSQEVYLKASNTQAVDSFGSAVGLSGDTAIVGAPFEDSAATGVNGDQAGNGEIQSGAAYVFVRAGSSWSQQAYLKASNTQAIDEFGLSVAMSVDTAVVGAFGEDSSSTGINGDQLNDDAVQAGAAYVFARSGTSWSQQAYLKASNAEGHDIFGMTVAASGSRVVVGAFLEDSRATGVDGNQSDNGAPGSGAAYLFVRGGSSWSQEAYLKASNTGELDYFGSSLALSDDAVVIGAWAEDSAATGVGGDQGNNGAADSGAAYVFGLCPRAGAAFRNGGTNPASYAAGPLVIGATFTATVDNGLAAQLSSLLFAFESPAAITLGGGQVLLCLDLGSGELFTRGALAPTASLGGVDSYALAIPDDPSLCGRVLYSQAVHFGRPPFALSNAQDLTIGAF